MLHENGHPNLKVDTLSIQNNTKLKSYTVEFFSGKFLSAPSGFELTTPRYQVQCSTTGLKGKDNFGKKNLSIPMPSGSTSDFKSRGREIEFQWGQKKIYLKKILPCTAV